MQKICLLTFDIPGPIRNGGVGTAFLALAEALVAEGHDVTILYPSKYSENLPLTHWIGQYRQRGIRLVSLFHEGRRKEAAYLAYHWLKGREFDVVHYHDMFGAGFWLTVAKRCGLAFHNTLLVCQAHGQTVWHLENSGAFLQDVETLECDWMERRSVEDADVLFSPSRYFCDYMKGRGWKLPARQFIAQNLLPASFDAGSAARAGAGGRITELVFFGRLETRKGVELFCQAIGAMQGRLEGVESITFLGKAGEVEGGNALAYLVAATAGWTVPWRVLTDLGTADAVAYLRGAGRLAVIASLMENSPYSVLECLAAGTAFIATDVGGIHELVAPADRSRTLFAPDRASLAACLAACLVRGQPPATPAIAPAANRLAWMKWHAALKADPHRPRPIRLSDKPLVSVCMSTFNRPEMLRHALDSIRAQSWPNLELVLVDDASPGEAARSYLDSLEPEFRQRGWTLMRNATEVWTGRARNQAVARAKGAYVLLMDDDNVALPHEVETMVRAAQASGADIVTCQQQPFTGPGPGPQTAAAYPQGWMPIGPSASQALFENCLGDLNMLVRTRVWRSLGGFTTEIAGCEDWEFLLHAVLAGHQLVCLPEILFSYRASEQSLARRYDARALYRSFARAVRPAQRHTAPALAMAMRFASEQHFAAKRERGEGYWQARGQRADLSGLSAAAPNGFASMLSAMKMVRDRGDKATARNLLRQTLRIAPSRPEVLLAWLQSEDATEGVVEDAQISHLATALPQQFLPVVPLVMSGAFMRERPALARHFAETLARRFGGGLD